MFIDRMEFTGEDTRTRKYIMPVKVLMTRGNVNHADLLLNKKPLQIGLNEPEVTTLDNRNCEDNAGVLLDFGFEFHGSLRLITSFLEQAAVVTVRLCFGESAAEALSKVGDKNATNDHSPRDLTVQLPLLSDNEYAQTGYRFVYIELLSQDAAVNIKSVIGVFIYRDIPYLGNFLCDDPIINRIYETAAYTCHLNMQNLLWDGIKRDRLVWIGDMHPEMLTIRTVFGKTDLIRQSLNFVRDQTPLPGWMNGLPSYSMWWLVILFDWYWYHGDLDCLYEQRDYALKLISQILSYINEDGTDTFPDYFLDWPTKDKPAAVDGVRALMARTLEASEKLAVIYKDYGIAEECRIKQQAICQLYGNYHGFKQAAALMLLSGIKDEGHNSEKTLRSGGAAGMSTFMSCYIFSAMARCGETEHVLDVLKEYYGGMLSMGATTFWEDFDIAWLQNACPIDCIPVDIKSDIHGDNGAYCYSGFRHSLCHGWASGPVPFLAEHVLGVQIEEAGCRTLRIHPHLGDLQWVKGSYPTPFGVVQIEHMKDKDGAIKTKVSAPDGVCIITE